MKSSREAWIVVDLGFGDAGKGTTVDFLVRERGARLVVRWNGGAQAGHNVVTDDGRHHTFAQFGAGTFVPGVRTHLAEPVLVHPTGLLVEAKRLAEIGVGDALARLTIAESARVVTPFHQAAGRIRELARGAARHGSCGIGIGETVRDSVDCPEHCIRARDLVRGDAWLRDELRCARERLAEAIADERRCVASMPSLRRELAAFDDAGVADRWMSAVAVLEPRSRVVPDAALGAMLEEGPSVFEGAQGILLDEWRGFHPHTTWSTCTPDAARALLATHGFAGPVRTLGVLRTYATRHGEGPLPTEDATLTARLVERHNASDGFQGAFRVGFFDAVLARHALAVSDVDALAVTHLDREDALTPFRACAAYRIHADDDGLFECESNGHATALRAGPPRDLAWQERLAGALRRAEPILETLPLGDSGTREARLLAWIEATLGRPVAVASHGPRARDKRATGAFGM
jgi:adenylosuccinate synthase